MIPSLVQELQIEALNGESSITKLVRQAFFLSKKLELNDITAWIKSEMEGYKDIPNENIPDYRFVTGHLKALNPYRGYIPVIISGDIKNDWSRQPLLQSVSEIEYLVNEAKNKNTDVLEYKFPPALQIKLMKSAGVAFETSLHIPVSQFERVINAVRDIILEWALDLEARGVKGENMTFNQNEKQSATQITNIHTHIGSMVNSQLQQNSDNSNQTLSVKEFNKESLHEIVEHGKALLEQITDVYTKAEFKAELTVLEAQVSSPKPKKGIIKECLSSIRNIAEGATGSVLVTLVPKVIEVLATL